MTDLDRERDPRMGTHAGADAFESLVHRIVEQNRPELTRRAARTEPTWLDRWWPTLAPAAMSLAAALMAGVMLVDPPEAEAAPTVAEAVLPTPVAAWLLHDYRMEPIEIMAALEGIEEVSR